MSTRISSALGLLLLSACEVKLPDRPAEAKAQSNARDLAEAEGRIECAAPGAGASAYSCAIDRTDTQDGLVLTLRHPDGGFRRLLVTRDGRGVVAADGAEEAVVKPLRVDLIEVELGGGRYRLPATVRAFDKQVAR